MASPAKKVIKKKKERKLFQVLLTSLKLRKELFTGILPREENFLTEEKAIRKKQKSGITPFT